jgi:hypothetical protein
VGLRGEESSGTSDQFSKSFHFEPLLSMESRKNEDFVGAMGLCSATLPSIHCYLSLKKRSEEKSQMNDGIPVSITRETGG